MLKPTANQRKKEFLITHTERIILLKIIKPALY